jgi:hypothetical protein
MTLDPAWIAAALEEIAATPKAQLKGKRLEDLVRTIFEAVPGLKFEGSNLKNEYGTEEIDLLFWNDSVLDGVYFLDCPLIIECKSSGKPVSGRDVRYFATSLKDKGRRSGVLVALNGIRGDEASISAGYFHLTAALGDGVTILILTADHLRSFKSGADVVAALRKALTELVKRQVLASESKKD